jgi:hypothetical protein
MSLLTGVLITGVCVAVAALLVVLFRQRAEDKALLEHQIETLRRQSAETGRAQTDALTQHLLKMTSEVNRQLESVGQRVQESQKSVGDRLESATRAVGEVQKSLGGASAKRRERIFEVGKDIASLQDILKAPKLGADWANFYLTDLPLANSSRAKRDVPIFVQNTGNSGRRHPPGRPVGARGREVSPGKISAK